MKILIADDEPVSRKLLRLTLAAEGHQVVEAADGIEALATLKSSPFDVVISDILMPRMDGYRLCYEVRRTKELKKIPIIIYSSTYTSAAEEDVALGMGASLFLRKPAPAAAILEAVGQAVRHPAPAGSPKPSKREELHVLKQYSERLVQKLEERNVELEAEHERVETANEELRRSDEQVRLLLDSTAEGIYGLDPRGRFTFVNAACLALLGYEKAEDLLGRKAHTLIHHTRPDGTPNPREDCGAYRTIRECVATHSEEDLLWRSDGTSFAAEFWSHPIRKEESLVGAVVTFLDVTERKRAQESIRMLQRAVDQTANAVFMTDPGGVITYVNPAFEKIYGYRAKEALGKTAQLIKSGHHQSAFYEQFWRRILAGESVREEFVNKRRDGELVTIEASVSPVVDASGKRVGFIAVQNDITERKRSEEALRKSEKRFALVFHANPVPASISETETGRFLDVNEQFLRLLGYSREEMIGRTSVELGIWVDSSQRQRMAERIVRDGEARGWDVQLRTRSGEIRSGIGSAVRVDVGSVPCLLSTFLDITERKHAEQESRRSEARFRRLFESNTIGIVISDMVGETLEANDAYLNLLGYTRAELLAGKIRWDELTPPEYRARDALAVEQLRSTGIAQPWEKVLLRKDGAPVPVLMGVAMLDPAEESCLVYIVDLTERRKAEEAIRASEERYRLLFESNPEPMWVFDRETLAFLAVNDSACRHYGYSREEFLGMTIREIRPPEDIPALMGQLAAEPKEYLAAGSWRHRKKDGAVIEVEISSYPLTFDGRSAQLVLAIDVTERKLAEERVQERTTFLNALLENSPLGILVLDAEHRVQIANPAFTRIFGYSREELMGRNPDGLIVPDPPAIVEEAARLTRDVLRGQTVHATTRRKHKDGRLVDVELYGVPLLQEGKLIGVYRIYEDTTERRHLEEQFRQAQKMEAVGQLAGGVAHDFNNLLTAILGYADILMEQVTGQDALVEEVEEIRKAGERAASLTRQLLAFSRRQVLDPKVLDVNEIVRNLEKMLRRLIGEDVTLATRLDPELSAIRADAGQIEQVVMNLVVNARDAMPRGGSVTIETADVDLDDSYARKRPVTQAGKYVMLAVSDTGVGMDADTQSRIFEPFFTTKGRGKGTGLGLSTVYGIVKQSGGYIWVYSELDKGTTFKVYLPVSADAVEAAEPLAAVGSLDGSETLLLVEDEDAVRALSRTILRKHGYTVIEAANGPQALELLESDPRPVHLVLTDLVMPTMSGTDLVSSIRQRRLDVRVLYMSGYTDDSVVRHGFLDKSGSFLQKPFTPDQLARKVREALDRE